MELNDFLQAARVVINFVTVALIAGYRPYETSTKRPGISCAAIILAGGSSCMAISTLLTWERWSCIPLAGQLVLTLILGSLSIPLMIGRGNVATLFPRKI